jgi:hypothetical protein
MIARAWKIPAMTISASNTMMAIAVAGRTPPRVGRSKNDEAPGAGGLRLESEGSAVGRAGRLSDTPWVNVPSV